MNLHKIEKAEKIRNECFRVILTATTHPRERSSCLTLAHTQSLSLPSLFSVCVCVCLIYYF